MAKWVIDSDTLTGIADAVRDQLGTEDTIKVSALAEAIASIEGGGGSVESGEYTPISASTTISFDVESESVSALLMWQTSTNNASIVLLAVIPDGAYHTSSSTFYGTCGRDNWGNKATSYCSSNPLTLEDGELTIDMTTSGGWSTATSTTKGATYSYIIIP